MLITVFSDIQIHNYKAFDTSTEDVYSSRLSNCLVCLERIFSFSHKNGIDTILFCGDLFDRQGAVPHIVLNRTVEAFKRLFDTYPEITFYAISGNHDQASKSVYGSPGISILDSLDLVFESFVLLDKKNVLIDSCIVVGIPYYEREEDFKKILHLKAHSLENDSSPVILLMHQTPKTNSVMPYECDPLDPLFDPFTLVLNGHIHKHEVHTPRFITVGSPLHRDLSDEGQDKGFIVIDTNDLSTFKRISLKGKFPEYVRRIEGEQKNDGNYEVIEPKIDVGEFSTMTFSSDFDSSLQASEILKNYWQQVDGANEDLLKMGLEFLR